MQPAQTLHLCDHSEIPVIAVMTTARKDQRKKQSSQAGSNQAGALVAAQAGAGAAAASAARAAAVPRGSRQLQSTLTASGA
jgi:hypothetical protein